MDAALVTSITSAVDFATIVTGVGTVIAAGMVLSVAIYGGRKLWGLIRA